jgi:hypothetical protein
MNGMRMIPLSEKFHNAIFDFLCYGDLFYVKGAEDRALMKERPTYKAKKWARGDWPIQCQNARDVNSGEMFTLPLGIRVRKLETEWV